MHYGFYDITSYARSVGEIVTRIFDSEIFVDTRDGVLCTEYRLDIYSSVYVQMRAE